MYFFLYTNKIEHFKKKQTTFCHGDPFLEKIQLSRPPPNPNVPQFARIFLHQNQQSRKSPSTNSNQKRFRTFTHVHSAHTQSHLKNNTTKQQIRYSSQLTPREKSKWFLGKIILQNFRVSFGCLNRFHAHMHSIEPKPNPLVFRTIRGMAKSTSKIKTKAHRHNSHIPSYTSSSSTNLMQPAREHQPSKPLCSCLGLISSAS